MIVRLRYAEAMPVADLWSRYLPTMRWFASFERPEVELTPLAWYATGEDVWVRSELARVSVDGMEQTYHLLVGYAPIGSGEPDAVLGQARVAGPGLVDVLDAPRSPRAMRAFLDAVCRGRVDGIVWTSDAPDAAAPTRMLTGEQSHTSVTIGDDTLLKIYRRLTPGLSMEPEVLGDLARLGPIPIVPALVGTWKTADGVRDLGLFEELVPKATDGYEYAVHACSAGVPFGDPMRALGQTLAELHRMLRDVYGSWTARTSELTASMSRRLDDACRELPRLVSLRAALGSRLAIADACEPLQRIHGDFHLGQALLSQRGWVVIDFEGEPLKTPRERRAPDTVWRDVAGLLRSLDYVRHTHPDPDGDAARMWLRDARAGFLAGYLGGTSRSDPLLTAYEIDKAVYELRYESRFRPGWVATPWDALCRWSRTSNETREFL
jgi:maltokinase